MEHVNAEANHTLDNLGIAKNAREERLRARAAQSNAAQSPNLDKIKQDAENDKMARLYREHVLGEKPIDGMVRLDAIRPASNNAASPINRRQEEADLVAGD
jgi:hypothetical protein